MKVKEQQQSRREMRWFLKNVENAQARLDELLQEMRLDLEKAPLKLKAFHQEIQRLRELTKIKSVS